MAMASICCRNPPLPLPDRPRSSSSADSTQHLWTANEGWLKRRCVLGAASMAIAFEIVNLAGGKAPAMEEPVYVADSISSGRWSEKRKCPQWRMNSLETIVPENLPRPLSRRRWEASGLRKSAPGVEAEAVVVNTRGSECFSM